jgi:hypothetical protein
MVLVGRERHDGSQHIAVHPLFCSNILDVCKFHESTWQLL